MWRWADWELQIEVEQEELDRGWDWLFFSQNDKLSQPCVVADGESRKKTEMAFLFVFIGKREREMFLSAVFLPFFAPSLLPSRISWRLRMWIRTNMLLRRKREWDGNVREKRIESTETSKKEIRMKMRNWENGIQTHKTVPKRLHHSAAACVFVSEIKIKSSRGETSRRKCMRRFIYEQDGKLGMRNGDEREKAKNLKSPRRTQNRLTYTCCVAAYKIFVLIMNLIVRHSMCACKLLCFLQSKSQHTPRPRERREKFH